MLNAINQAPVAAKTRAQARLKLLIWTSIPTHHQSAFLQALRDDGIDLVVHYFSRINSDRINLGWSASPALLPDEHYVEPHVGSLENCKDWRERIHIVPGYSNLFLLQLALRLSLHRVPWLHWSEPSRPWIKWYLAYPIKRTYAFLLNRCALGALAIGELARDDFVRWGVRQSLIRLLPYSIAPLDRRTLSSVEHPTSLNFLFVGSLCHRKGIDILLKAFRVALNHHRDISLTLVGYDTSDGKYAELARALSIQRAVRFMESIPADQVAKVMASSHVVILPSRFDGWGMVLAEAASLSLALIGTHACGSAHHLIEDGVNGFKVPPADVEALAAAMLRYCDDPTLVKTHGERSAVIFHQFVPARNALRLRECLASLQASRG